MVKCSGTKDYKFSAKQVLVSLIEKTGSSLVILMATLFSQPARALRLSRPIILPIFFLRSLRLAVKQIVLKFPFMHVKLWPRCT